MADLTAIQFLRTSTAGKIPSVNVLHEGALAINLTDRTIYTKNAAGAIIDLGFGKGGAVKGNIDLTGNLTGTGVVSAPTGNFTTSNITTLNASNMTITGVAQAIRKFTVVESGNPSARIDLVSTPTQSQSVGMYTTESTDYTSFNSEIGGSKLLEIRKGKSGQKPQVISYGEFISNDIIAKNLRFSNDYGQYAIEALTAQAYSGSGDTNGINFVFRGRSNSTATIYHTIIDGRAGTNNQVAHYHGNTPQHKIWAYGSAGSGGWGNFVGSLSVGFDGLSGLNRGLAVGHELSGLVGSQNQLSLYAGNVETLRITHGSTTSLKAVNIYAGGLANNQSSLMISTNTDSNGSGDGNTHIGYLSSGKINHYFRGTGSFIIDSHQGAVVAAGLTANGEILSNTRVTAKGTTTSFNGLRSETTGNGWSYLALKSGSSEAHIAHNNTVAEGAVANSLHLRPNGQQNGSLIIQPANQMIHTNQYGSVSIGALNGQYAHFNTSNPQFYFYKDILSAGNFFAEGGQKVFHQGFLPTASQLGVLSTSGGTMTGNITYAGGRLTLSSHNIYYSDASSSAASGFLYNSNVNDPAIVAFGSHWNGTNKTIVNAFVVGTGNSWWNGDLLKLDPNGLLYVKSQGTLYGDNRKPTPTDIGAAPAVHEHDYILARTGDRDILPSQLKHGALRAYFRNSTTGSSFMDFIPLNTYVDQSGGGTNAIAAHKATGILYHHFAAFGAASWGTPYKIYSELAKPTPADIGAIPISGLIATGQIGGTGNSDIYTGAGIETRSSGAASPSIGFHKPGSYAGTLRMVNSGKFAFVNQDNSQYGDLQIRTLFADTVNSTNITAGGWISAPSGGIAGGYLGVSNSSNTSGNGISLYSGATAGQPTYGLMFAGTATFGKLGSVTGDWATYFNMNADNTRGWIFKAGVGSSGNVASISGGGNAYFVGNMEAQEVYARGWLRTTNSSGWYNETYGGGIHMSDWTWVRIYNGKQFFVDSTASDAIRTSGGVTATGNISASTFSGNGSALTGLTSAQVGLGNVPNTVHTTAANANTVVVRDGSGWLNAVGFRGNGSQLTNLSWSNIVGRPTETNQWHTVSNWPGLGTKTIALPSEAINHLVAGQMVKFRVWFNRSGSQRSERRMREFIIDGADGWAGVQWDAFTDCGWPGVSSCYVRNAASNDVALRNTISSQYSNITRFEYQLL